MNSNLRNLLLFLGALCGLLFPLAGLALNWPIWSWALLAAAVAGLLLGMAEPGRGSRAWPEDHGQVPVTDVPPPSEPLYRERKIEGVALPSRLRDYAFVFSATVRWHYPPEYPAAAFAGDPGAQAADALLTRARRVTEHALPGAYTLVRHQLSASLAEAEPVPGSPMLAMAREVSLVLHEEDRERLARLSSLRKEETLWQQRMGLERLQRSYFGEEVLKDAGSAVIWQLAASGADVPETVDRIGLLAQLAAAANNTEVPEVFRPYLERAEGAENTPAADDQFGQGPLQAPPPGEAPRGASPAAHAILLLEQTSAGAPDGALDLSVERMVKMLRQCGLPEDAEQVRRHFAPPTAHGQPDGHEAPFGSPPGGGEPDDGGLRGDQTRSG